MRCGRVGGNKGGTQMLRWHLFKSSSESSSGFISGDQQFWATEFSHVTLDPQEKTKLPHGSGSSFQRRPFLIGRAGPELNFVCLPLKRDLPDGWRLNAFWGQRRGCKRVDELVSFPTVSILQNKSPVILAAVLVELFHWRIAATKDKLYKFFTEKSPMSFCYSLASSEPKRMASISLQHFRSGLCKSNLCYRVLALGHPRRVCRQFFPPKETQI